MSIDFKKEPMAFCTRREVTIAVACACVITLLQVTLLIGSSDGATFAERYANIFQDDSLWFESIVDHGYRAQVPPVKIAVKMYETNNVAFFPAYPLLGSAVKRIFHLPTRTALSLAAQFAAWGFWTYALLFLRAWKIPLLPALTAVVLIASHPAAFFLVAPYSESLFLMLLFGFLFWLAMPGRFAKWIAAAHGFGMCATRIVGIACAAWPAIWALISNPMQPRSRSWWRRQATAWVISAVSVAGALCFFLFCHLRFGQWNMYMQTQKAGWNVTPDYFAIFRPDSYDWDTPILDEDYWQIPDYLSRYTLPVFLVTIAGFVIAEICVARFSVSHLPQRAVFYFVAFAIFYVSVSGVSSLWFLSMIRYHLCTHAALVLAAVHLSRDVRRQAWVRWPVLISGWIISAVLLRVQIYYATEFCLKNWVA